MRWPVSVAAWAALVSGTGCVAVTSSVGVFSTPLEVTSATTFTGVDDTAVQQANDWEVDSAVPSLGVAFPIAPPVVGVVAVSFPSKTLVVTEAGLETTYAFDDGAVWAFGVATGLEGWHITVGYSLSRLDDAEIQAGTARRTAGYEWDGLGLRVGYSDVLKVALDFSFGEGRFTETRYLPSVATRAVEFERETKVDLVLGVGGKSGETAAFLSLSLIGTTGLSAGLAFGF
ncbi:MAG: hypothetical protein ACYTKD_16830 [Planctomycetota bacterium]|jgi:hypothetical protein